MTRPRKATQHCRNIIRLRYQNNRTESSTNTSESDDDLDPDDAVETIDDFSEGSSIRTVDEALQWVEKAYCKSRAPHHGDSRRTQFRRQAEKKPG